MLIANRERQRAVDQLVEMYAECRISRRAFLQRSTAAGLSLSAATSLLTTCAGDKASPDVDVLNPWSGEEQASFKAVVAPFSRSTGITVALEVTRDLSDTLAIHFQNDHPPDIAILPNPGYMQELVDQHHLIPLDSFLDMDQIRRDYEQTWLDLGTYRGQLYALFYKTTNKGVIWYSPQRFQERGYQIPRTWDELLALSDRIAQSGQYPWALGMESGGSNGWPGADWIAEIYLNQSGPQMYDQWVRHQIPWFHPSVREAFQFFGQIIAGQHYISGAPQSILKTNFSVACSEPFTNPPLAYMNYLGDFAPGFIKSKLPNVQAGIDFNFFPFPTINSGYAGAVTGGADVVVVMRDTSEVRQLVRYMATAQAQEIWVKRGGFTSSNKSVSLNVYPNPVARDAAQMLKEARIYRLGADDLMPPPVEQAFWEGVWDFIQDRSQLNTVLQNIERVARQHYKP